MRRHVIRNGLIGLGVLIVLAVAAGAIAIARFDPNTLKPRIEAAVEQATGRRLALDGPITLHPSLWPTVALHDVSLENPPGFSGASMATLQQLDVQLALWPLLFHQVQIDQLVLVQPNIRLETNAKGQTNWNFAPPQKPGAPAEPKAAPQAEAKPNAIPVSVDHLRIKDGTLSYRNAVTGRSTTLVLRQFSADAASPQSPLTVTADAVYAGTAFSLRGKLGSIHRLLNPNPAAPWPVQATLQADGAKLAVEGSIRQPLQGHGYDLALIGNVPDLAALSPIVPGIALPPLRDVRFSVRLRDQGKPLPDITALTLEAGSVDLNQIQPGLRLAALKVSMPAMNRPVHLSVQGQLAAAPLQLDGTLGPLGALIGRPTTGAATWPVDLTGQAAGAQLAVKGSIAQPAELKGVNLQVSADVPDLSTLIPVVHRPLPARQSARFSARVTEGPGGLTHSVALHDLKLVTPQADASGEMTLGFGRPPSVTATLHSTLIDVDALMAVLLPPPPEHAPAVAAAKPAPGSGRAVGGTLIPDTKLPFGLLRDANANITLSADEVSIGGQQYRKINTHLVLKDGKLRLDPFAATLPQGHLSGTLSADGAAAKPPVTLTLRAPGLALQPLLAALHQPAYATGNLEVLADLHGAGDSPHAIAADLDGSVGLAMEGGTVDVKLLRNLLGPVLAKADLLRLLAGSGTSQVKCFAFRMDARHGIGQLRTLVLSSSALSFDGGGSVDLGHETLAMDLRPQGRIAGTGFVVPLRLTGSLRDPAVTVNTVGAATSNIGSLAGAAAGAATPFGAIAGALTGGSVSGAGEGLSCPGPLAIARGQKPAAQPARTAPAPAAKPAIPAPKNLIQELFR